MISKQVKPRNFRKIPNGFTLAEVLITIAIIGITASLTIPTLINNIQTEQRKIAWKKAYSVLSQATNQIREDKGGTLLDAFYNGGSVIPVYQNYINIVKRCNWPQSAPPHPCWASTTEPDLVAGAVLSNGIFIQVDGDDNCTSGCARFLIDINGAKGPNACGEDIFKFDVLATRQLPSGADGALWTGKPCFDKSSEYLTN